jgi:hypothetical protein
VQVELKRILALGFMLMLPVDAAGQQPELVIQPHPSGRRIDEAATRIPPIIAWAAHDTLLAIARDSAIEVWPLTPHAPFTLTAQIDPIAAIAISPNGRLLAAGTLWSSTIGRYTHMENGDLHVWDLITRRHVLGEREGLPTTNVRFTRTGRLLAVQHEENTPDMPCEEDEYCGAPESLEYDVVLAQLDVPSFTRSELAMLGHDGMDERAAAYFSEAGDRIAVRTGDGGRIIDVATLRPLPAFRNDSALMLAYSAFPRGCRSQPPDDFRFSADGKRAVVISNGAATLIDAAKGTVLMQPDSLHATYDEGAMAGAFAPNGTLLLVTCDASRAGGSRMRFVQPDGRQRSVHYDDGASDDVLFHASGSFFTRDGNVITLYSAAGVRRAVLLRARNGDWLVVTPDGLYDGNAGGLGLAAWRVGGRLLPPNELPRGRHVPGLLARLLADE